LLCVGEEGRGQIPFAGVRQHDDDALAPALFRLRGKDEAEALFAKACRLWQRKDTAFREECLSLLYRIIALIKKEAARYSQKDKVLTALSPALSYISESYLSENIPIAHLASLCHMSETYLRRLFHSAFSVSPAVYTRNLRIKYAEELLRSGEHSVTDAATLAGFNDIAYFSRTFKKATGISPREYARTYGEE
jgi:AraC-like DNA-binding protein